jgi:hypothetical protein
MANDIKDENQSREQVEHNLQQAIATELAHTATLAELQERLSRLEAESDPATSQSGMDAATEIFEVRKSIATFSDAVNTFRRWRVNLEAKLRLLDFDREAAKLTEVSTEMGAHVAEAATLMEDASATAEELVRIVLEAIPEDSPFRKGWENAADSFFGPSAFSEAKKRLEALKETARTGEYVKNRTDALRIFLQSILKGRN